MAARDGGVVGAAQYDAFVDDFGYAAISPEWVFSNAAGSTDTALTVWNHTAGVSIANVITTAAAADVSTLTTRRTFKPPLLLTAVVKCTLGHADSRAYMELVSEDGLDILSAALKQSTTNFVVGYGMTVNAVAATEVFASNTYGKTTLRRLRMLWTESLVEVTTETLGASWDGWAIEKQIEYNLPAFHKAYKLRFRSLARDANAAAMTVERVAVQEFHNVIVPAPAATGEALASVIA